MEEHKKEEVLLSEPPSVMIDSVSIQSCTVHAGKELELYCETCLELICLKCAIKGGKHHSHDYEELDEAFDKCKDDIATSMRSIEKKLKTASEVLAQLDTSCEDVSDVEQAVEADINSTVERFHELIDTRKVELIKHLHELAQGKKDWIAARKCQVETIQADLSSYLDFMRETLAMKSDMDVLVMKMAIMMQVEELPTPNQRALKGYIGPETDMNFSVSSEVTSACENYGQIGDTRMYRAVVKKSEAPAFGKALFPRSKKLMAGTKFSLKAHTSEAFSLPTAMIKEKSACTSMLDEGVEFECKGLAEPDDYLQACTGVAQVEPGTRWRIDESWAQVGEPEIRPEKPAAGSAVMEEEMPCKGKPEESAALPSTPHTEMEFKCEGLSEPNFDNLQACIGVAKDEDESGTMWHVDEPKPAQAEEPEIQAEEPATQSQNWGKCIVTPL